MIICAGGYMKSSARVIANSIENLSRTGLIKTRPESVSTWTVLMPICRASMRCARVYIYVIFFCNVFFFCLLCLYGMWIDRIELCWCGGWTNICTTCNYFGSKEILNSKIQNFWIRKMKPIKKIVEFHWLYSPPHISKRNVALSLKLRLPLQLLNTSTLSLPPRTYTLVIIFLL